MRAARDDMRQIGRRRKLDLAGNHHIGDGARVDLVNSHVLRAERTHVIGALGQQHGADPIGRRRRQPEIVIRPFHFGSSMSL